ncbi:MAG: PadR family transcriptional regulator [Acidimicrobiales bacterium]
MNADLMAEHDPQMLKGIVAMLLLRVLAGEESYGYSIVERLQAAGFTDLSEGTVYPALSRLEQKGLLESRLVRSASGPARKYYRPTVDGRAELARLNLAWSVMIDQVAAIAPAGSSAPSEVEA